MTVSIATPALVNADWAVEHLGDPSVRFVEVDVDTTAYAGGHLPSAVAWDWTSQLTDGVRRDIATPADLSKLLSNSGISPDTHIALYGDNNNWFAAWAYWQLKLHGLEPVSLVDGGRKLWLQRNLPLTTDVPAYQPTGFTVQGPSYELRAFRDELLPRVGDPGLGLVDVRSPAEYSGEILAPPGMSESAQRGGHIPGAASIPWSQAVREDGSFKSPDELAALYQGEGITPDKDIVTYCRIGERSSHSWFVLHEILGYPSVRNYDGSWTEWGSMVAVPIERGSPSAS